MKTRFIYRALFDQEFRRGRRAVWSLRKYVVELCFKILKVTKTETSAFSHSMPQYRGIAYSSLCTCVHEILFDYPLSTSSPLIHSASSKGVPITEWSSLDWESVWYIWNSPVSKNAVQLENKLRRSISQKLKTFPKKGTWNLSISMHCLAKVLML